MERRDRPEQDLEQQLQAHFKAEAEDLRAPADLWQRVQRRMTEQPSATPRWRGSWGSIFNTRFTLRIAGAVAAVLIIATVVAVPVFFADDGGDPLLSGGGPAGPLGPRSEPGPTGFPSSALPTPIAAAMAEAGVAGSGGMDGDSIDSADDFPSSSTPSGSSSGAASAESQPYPPLRPGATIFEDYERQQYVDTSHDSVSTFSLDTDRTSLTLALNWARQGYAVEPDSVRAEEWVNAFEYGYAKPPHGSDSFAIMTTVAGHPLDSGKHLVRLAFQAPEVVDDKPLNVTLVLDASGSMGEGNRVDIARAAAEAIRQGLRPQDRIAVVHFTDDVLDHLTVKHRRPSDREVQLSIDALQPNGATNVQAGLDLGIALADAMRLERPDAWHYVILMSDGVANVDATNPFAILESAADYNYDYNRRNPLRLITIGVGIENYNDYLLEQLAQHGNGWYRYLDEVEQARWTFSRENWLSLAVPFADQARAQVTWNPDVVRSWRIVGYENRVTPNHTFQQNRKEFAEIPSGAATTVFYEVELWDSALRGEPRRLGEVELRWVEPGPGASREQGVDIVGPRFPVTFDRLNDAMFKFGAIVALAADRYSGRVWPTDAYEVWHGVLASLEPRLGHLDSYRDFLFLLAHLAAHATYVNPEPRPDTGYSD